MPYNVVNQYPYGTRLRHICRVLSKGDAADPSTLRVYFIDPLGNETGPFTPTRDAQGLYEFQQTYTATTPTAVQGLWTTFWRGTGVAEGSIIRQFQIQALNIASSI